MEVKKNKTFTKDKKNIYDVIVSYLRILYRSNSELFILRPEEELKTINLRPILQDELKYKFVKYLLKEEKEGAEFYVKRSNKKMKHVKLSNWFSSNKTPKLVQGNLKAIFGMGDKNQ